MQDLHSHHPIQMCRKIKLIELWVLSLCHFPDWEYTLVTHVGEKVWGKKIYWNVSKKGETKVMNTTRRSPLTPLMITWTSPCLICSPNKAVTAEPWKKKEHTKTGMGGTGKQFVQVGERLESEWTRYGNRRISICNVILMSKKVIKKTKRPFSIFHMRTKRDRLFSKTIIKFSNIAWHLKSNNA